MNDLRAGCVELLLEVEEWGLQGHDAYGTLGGASGPDDAAAAAAAASSSSAAASSASSASSSSSSAAATSPSASPSVPALRAHRAGQGSGGVGQEEGPGSGPADLDLAAASLALQLPAAGEEGRGAAEEGHAARPGGKGLGGEDGGRGEAEGGVQRAPARGAAGGELLAEVEPAVGGRLAAGRLGRPARPRGSPVVGPLGGRDLPPPPPGVAVLSLEPRVLLLPPSTRSGHAASEPPQAQPYPRPPHLPYHSPANLAVPEQPQPQPSQRPPLPLLPLAAALDAAGVARGGDPASSASDPQHLPYGAPAAELHQPPPPLLPAAATIHAVVVACAGGSASLPPCGEGAAQRQAGLEVLVRAGGRYLPVRLGWQLYAEWDGGGCTEWDGGGCATWDGSAAAPGMAAGQGVRRLQLLTVELLELPARPGPMVVDFRWRGEPCRAVPLLLTADPHVAAELGRAAASWPHDPAGLDALLLDYGTWERHACANAEASAAAVHPGQATAGPAAAPLPPATTAPADAPEGDPGAPGCAPGAPAAVPPPPASGRPSTHGEVVAAADLARLGRHLLRSAEAAGWVHTAARVQGAVPPTARAAAAAAPGGGARATARGSALQHATGQGSVAVRTGNRAECA